MNRMKLTGKARATQLSLQIQIDPKALRPDADRSQLRRWILASLDDAAELTLRFVGRAEARQLNRQFRNRDHPTNVLTFNYEAERLETEGIRYPPIQADIVICMDVLAREARAQHKVLKNHLAHLVIHGTLHAQGWDHQKPTDAANMEAREIQILKRFRIGNPYHFQRVRQIGNPGKLRYPQSVETT